MAHEVAHLAGSDCGPRDTLRRSGFAGVTQAEGECEAYSEQLDCLDRELEKCGSNTPCENQLIYEWSAIRERASMWCSRANDEE